MCFHPLVSLVPVSTLAAACWNKCRWVNLKLLVVIMVMMVVKNMVICNGLITTLLNTLSESRKCSLLIMTIINRDHLFISSESKRLAKFLVFFNATFSSVASWCNICAALVMIRSSLPMPSVNVNITGTLNPFVTVPDTKGNRMCLDGSGRWMNDLERCRTFLRQVECCKRNVSDLTAVQIKAESMLHY